MGIMIQFKEFISIAIYVIREKNMQPVEIVLCKDKFKRIWDQHAINTYYYEIGVKQIAINEMMVDMLY